MLQKKHLVQFITKKGSGAKNKNTTESHMSATQIIVFIFQRISESVLISVKKSLII